MKLTEFTFKTGNRRGCNNVIRKRIPNINDPTGKKVAMTDMTETDMRFAIFGFIVVRMLPQQRMDCGFAGSFI